VEYLPDIVARDIQLVFAVNFLTETSSTESNTLALRRLYILFYGEHKLDGVDGGESNSKAP
jgi:hypothetical protein